MSLARTRPLPEARARFREAEAAFVAAGASIRVVDVLIEEARALAASFRRAHLDEALLLLERAADMLAASSPSGAGARAGVRPATLAHVRGYTLVRAGRLGAAEEALRQAERLFREAQDSVGEARVLDTLGVLFERTADRERAALLLAHSHALKQRAGDEDGVAISLGNLGRLALHGGNAREAEPFFKLDLELVRERGDVRAQGVLLTNLAECALEQGEVERARSYAREALRHALETDNVISVGYARVALAETHRHDGEPAEAAREVDAAIEAFAGARMDAGLAAARLLHGHLKVDWGHTREGAAWMLAAARTARRVAQHEQEARALLAAYDALQEGVQDVAHGATSPGLEGRTLRVLGRAQDAAIASGLPKLERAVRQRRLRVAHAWALEEITVPFRAERGELPGGTNLQIQGVLGAGAEATVLAVEGPAGTSFALKVLHAGHRGRFDAMRRAGTEFETLATLPEGLGTVALHAVGWALGGPALLMDHVHGRMGATSLADLATSLGRAPRGLQHRVAKELAATVQQLHLAGTAHRDIKLENVLLAADGRNLLADFGLAAKLGTEAATRFGTLAYAAPEQLAGDSRIVTTAHDAFALGTLLWRLGTGTWPFGDALAPSSVAAAKQRGVQGLRAPGLSSELEACVRQLLEPDPAQRMDLAEVVAAFADLPRR